MMADELQRYQEYERFIRCLFKLAGIWPRSKDYCYLYGQLPGLTVACGFVTVYGIVTLCIRYIANLHLFIRGMNLVASIVNVVLKAIIFRIYRDDLHELTDTLESLFHGVLNDPRMKPVALSSFRLFYHPPYVFSFLSSNLILMYVLTPLILIGYQFAKGVERVHYALPFPVAFPWNVEGPGLLYALTYLIEGVLCWFLVFVTSAVDALFGYYVFQMSGLLRVLSYEFETLNFNDDHATTLKRCVRKHNAVLRCRDIVQDVYGPIVLYLAVINAFSLCSLIFQVAEADEMTIGKATLFLFYTLLKLAQTLLYAWYGSVLTTESEVFQREVYCSGWYESEDKSFAKGIIVLLMQKPILLTASHIVPISVDLFVGILNTTVSYFFLLQTLEDDD